MPDSHPPREKRQPRRAKRAKGVTAAQIEATLARGLSWSEASKVLGVSQATIARRLKHGDPEQLTRPAPAPALAPALAPDAGADAPADAKERAARVIRRLEQIVFSDEAPAAVVSAGKALLEDCRREVAAASYRDVTTAREVVGLAIVEARLGAIMRRLIDAGDEELGELYRASAAATASPEDRAALNAWLELHPEIKREAVYG